MPLFSPVFKEMAKKDPRWRTAYKKTERLEIVVFTLLAIIMFSLLVYFSLDIPPTF